MSDTKPSKTLKVGGTVNVLTDDNTMMIDAADGLISVVVADVRGHALYMWHPLSGWYIEYDGRKEPNSNEPSHSIAE